MASRSHKFAVSTTHSAQNGRHSIFSRDEDYSQIGDPQDPRDAYTDLGDRTKNVARAHAAKALGVSKPRKGQTKDLMNQLDGVPSEKQKFRLSSGGNRGFLHYEPTEIGRSATEASGTDNGERQLVPYDDPRHRRSRGRTTRSPSPKRKRDNPKFSGTMTMSSVYSHRPPRSAKTSSRQLSPVPLEWSQQSRHNNPSQRRITSTKGTVTPTDGLNRQLVLRPGRYDGRDRSWYRR